MVRIFLLISLLIQIAMAQEVDSITDTISKEIVFLSDTQAPIWIESVFLKNQKNRKATQLIFEDLLRRKPLALFILGDVVSLGYSARQWKIIDPYLKKLRDAGVEVHAILGNHELIGRARAGERKFQMRFPEHVRTGYVRILGSVGVIMLNSNFKHLTVEDINLQDRWYEGMIEKLENDEAIDVIIVACHHSPFSNSVLVGSSKAVQEKFVPKFLEAKKGLLFLTGHSHAFEYFKDREKDFIIIGGGGGLRHPLATKLTDLAPQYKPMFHYLSVKKMNESLKVISHPLSDEFTKFQEGFSIDIPIKKD